MDLDWEGTNSTKHIVVLATISRYWNNKAEEYDLHFEMSDRCNELPGLQIFNTNLESLDGKAKHRTQTQINIYTDGSRKNEQTGAGFTIYVYRRRRTEIAPGSARLPDFATVFQVEITAVAEACLYLNGNGSADGQYIKIFIDLQAAILLLITPRSRVELCPRRSRRSTN